MCRVGVLPMRRVSLFYLCAESIPDAGVGVGIGYRLGKPSPIRYRPPRPLDTGHRGGGRMWVSTRQAPVHSIPDAEVGVGFGYRFRKLSPVRYRAPGWGSGLGIDSASARPFDARRRGQRRIWVSNGGRRTAGQVGQVVSECSLTYSCSYAAPRPCAPTRRTSGCDPHCRPAGRPRQGHERVHA